MTQGSILGPMLFNMAMNKFPSVENITELWDGWKVRLYADDVAAILGDWEVEYFWGELQKWRKEWGLELNYGPGKTMAIPVNSNKEDFIKNSGIPIGSEYKYLGLRLQIEKGKLKIKETVAETILKE